jgi:para-nitrobenzyl esterase
MRRPLVLLLFLLALAAGCTSPGPGTTPDADPSSLRAIAGGEVVGFANPSGGHTWLGIPYAAPPVGDFRWRAPRPVTPWTEPRQTLRPGSACIQRGSRMGGIGDEGSRQGSEDCLYLNVYAPRLAPAELGSARLPVMVWIHGGGNTIGHAGFYDGQVLAQREKVLVVMINYRLGPFGWFVPPANPQLTAGGDDPDLSGNYGNLDVLAALRWVQSNAAGFGGDPTRVTVFGESAGGTNTLALLVMPGADGLFHRLIVQSSGFGFSRPPAPDSPAGTASLLRTLLQTTGRAPDPAAAATLAASMDAEAQSAFLRSLDPWTIYAAYDRSGGTLDRFPTVYQDGLVLRRGPLPELLADPATHHDVPVILGTNRDENKMFMAFDRQLVRSAFGLPFAARDPEAYEREARYRSLKWKADSVDSLADVLGTKGAPAWAYRWDWDEQGKAYNVVDLTRLLGAAHGLEIPFVFGFFDVGPQSGLLFHEDNAAGRLALSERMMAYWAGFARNGIPGRGSDARGNEWQPWTSDTAAPRMIVFDSPAGGGIRMEPSNASRVSLVAMLEQEPLVDEQRCALFKSVFRDRLDDWADAAWPRFNGGRCSGQRLTR